MHKFLTILLITLSTLLGLVTGHKFGYEKAKLELQSSFKNNPEIGNSSLQNKLQDSSNKTQSIDVAQATNTSTEEESKSDEIKLNSQDHSQGVSL